jgi:DNA-directed RNA polymerase beta subunit
LKKKNNDIITEKFITKFISELGNSILYNTNSMNLQLLREIQHVENTENIVSKIKPVLSKLREMKEDLEPLLTVDIFSKNVCFAALIYKNKDVYRLIRKTTKINDDDIDTYLLDYINIITNKMSGGNDSFFSLNIFNKLWGQKKNVPWYFVLSLLSILWSSYVLHYSSIEFVNHIENNTAAKFIKNTFSNTNQDFFKCNIEYNEKEQFYLDILKKTKFLDEDKIDIIAKVFNRHRCLLEKPTIFKENLFFHKMKIPKEIGAPKPQINNFMENVDTSSSSKSLQMVSNPSLHLTLYNRNENKENEQILHYLKASISQSSEHISYDDSIRYITSSVIYTPINMDKDEGQKKKKDFAIDVLTNDLFPHCKTKFEKIYLLGHMTNKIIRCALGECPPDDRDSYSNKRVELTGTLLNNLFRNYFNKVVKDIQKQVIREINNGS